MKRDPRIIRYRRPCARQRGAALAVALVFLVVLTIIGVTALRTTTLEERMAGNLQEHTRAFQAAEAGVARTISDVNNFSSGQAVSLNAELTNPSVSAQDTYLSSASMSTSYLGQTAPTRSPKAWGLGSAAFHHFDIESTGTTGRNAKVTVDQGVYLVGAPGN